MNRIDSVIERVDGKPFIITSLLNIRYLTGYRGDYAILLITKDKVTLITDSRYEESSKREVRGAEILIIKDGLLEELVSILSTLKTKEVCFEKESIKYAHYEKIRTSLNEKRLVPISDIVEELRMRKDEEEIKSIKRACAIGDIVIQEVLNKVTARSTEKDITAEIEYLIKKRGGDKQSFDAIVASGDNSALPHAQPTDRKITGQDILLVDMGAYFNGYASDMTRTFLLKEGKKEKKLYQIVYEAQKRAIEAIKPDISLKDVDGIARGYIRDNKYDGFFGHGLGHGVGLCVHELPRVSSKSTHKAEEGMVFSIEPGIYIPGFGGVRIEDLVLVTKTGCEVLTKTPKSLAEAFMNM